MINSACFQKKVDNIIIGNSVSDSHQLLCIGYLVRRITSYNVCYTKLLRYKECFRVVHRCLPGGDSSGSGWNGHSISDG